MRIAHVFGTDCGAMAKDLKEQLTPARDDIVLFFASSALDPRDFADHLSQHMPKNTYGCTTAGEIGPQGYADDSVVGMCFAGGSFRVEPDVVHFDESAKAPQPRPCDQGSGFTISLIDGLSMREEIAASRYYSADPRPMVGGSAGDDLAFKATHLYCEGQVLDNAAMFLRFCTDVPFRTFKAHHFEPTPARLIITSSDPNKRVVHEINGFPAIEEYARQIGVAPSDCTAEVFSKHPVLLRLAGDNFVRSIRQQEPDGSLSFFCAIEDGVVLHLASRRDIYDSFDETVQNLTALGNPTGTLLFECVLRKIEMAAEQQKAAAFERVKNLNSVGFHTYGEQLNGIHINQTLTGISFYEAA